MLRLLPHHKEDQVGKNNCFYYTQLLVEGDPKSTVTWPVHWQKEFILLNLLTLLKIDSVLCIVKVPKISVFCLHCQVVTNMVDYWANLFYSRLFFCFLFFFKFPVFYIANCCVGSPCKDALWKLPAALPFSQCCFFDTDKTKSHWHRQAEHHMYTQTLRPQMVAKWYTQVGPIINC